jgi:acetyl esterase/lipase
LNAAEEPAEEDERVLLCFHGGGYTELSAYPEDVTSVISKGLLEALEDKGIRRAFSVEYRLSKGDPYEPAHPFPTALLDALSGYYYLVQECGFKPKNIIIEGDSAGGNLALALTRYLCATAGTIPELPGPPGATILLSPWTDLSGSHDIPGSSVRTFYESDYLGYPLPESQMQPNIDPERFMYQIRAFTGPHGLGAASFNEYISPASKRLHAPKSLFRFSGASNDVSSDSPTLWPPTFIAGGGAELLLDQIRTLKERMVEGGVDLEYFEAPDGTHDWVAYKWFEPERSETLAAIAAWFGKQQH